MGKHWVQEWLDRLSAVPNPAPTPAGKPLITALYPQHLRNPPDTLGPTLGIEFAVNPARCPVLPGG